MLTQLFRGTPVIKLKNSDFDFSGRVVRITNKHAVEHGGILALQMAWCHYCQKNNTVLNILSQKVGKTHPILVLDGVDHPQIMDQFMARGLVQGYPTVYTIHTGGGLGRKYSGPRTVDGYMRLFA